MKNMKIIRSIYIVKVYGRLERSFHLDDIDEDTMEAVFKDGILTISVSKADEDRNKKFITIK